MTGRALPFALEERLSTSQITWCDRDVVACGDAAQVRDDHPGFERGVVVRGHRGARNTLDDDLHQLLVGRRAFVPSAQQRNTANAIALRAVTRRATCLEESRAVLDLGARVAMLC